jgi:hypothetical protein
MRFRRSILASLAPLLSLSAFLAAAAAPGSVSDPKPNPNSLVRFLRSVACFVAPDTEHGSVSASPSHPSPRAVLDFGALAATPLAHSIWLVETPPAVDAIARRHLRTQLRC